MFDLPITESTPFFDKVSFTCKIPDQLKMVLLDKINDVNFYKKYNRKVYSNSGGWYKNNYQFKISGDITVELSLYPKDPDQNFLRAEYNPTKLGKKGRKQLRLFFIELLGVGLVKRVYFEANLTRIDITLDDYNMESNLYIYRPGSKVSSIYRHEDNEAIISQIIGSDSSDIRVTLYDKEVQLSGEKLEQHPTSYQRLEIRYRLRGYTMSTLDNSLLDEFSNIRFYRSTFLEDDRLDPSFIDLAFKHGITFAMSQIDDNTRRRYRRYLEVHRVYPINMADLNFNLAHYYALRSLVHTSFKDEKMVKKQRSLLQGGVSFRKVS